MHGQISEKNMTGLTVKASFMVMGALAAAMVARWGVAAPSGLAGQDLRGAREEGKEGRKRKRGRGEGERRETKEGRRRRRQTKNGLPAKPSRSPGNGPVGQVTVNAPLWPYWGPGERVPGCGELLAEKSGERADGVEYACTSGSNHPVRRRRRFQFLNALRGRNAIDGVLEPTPFVLVIVECISFFEEAKCPIRAFKTCERFLWGNFTWF